MERALIVSSTEKSQFFLSELLKNNAFRQLLFASGANAARRMLTDCEFDLIVINTPLSDEFGHELAMTAAEIGQGGVIMLVKAELADEISAKVEDEGVFVLPKPVSRQFFFQALKLVEASQRRLRGLKSQNISLQSKIEEIRMVDRAKCALIQYLNMTEPQAHRYIEKQAMDLRLTRREVAREILKTYES